MWYNWNQMKTNIFTWLARRFSHTREVEIQLVERDRIVDRLENHVIYMDVLVNDIRNLLPGDKRPQETTETLEVFGERAVKDIGTLMAACIDYRNLLIRADVPDQVSGQHEGIEDIFEKYGIPLEVRKKGNDPVAWGLMNRPVD